MTSLISFCAPNPNASPATLAVPRMPAMLIPTRDSNATSATKNRTMSDALAIVPIRVWMRAWFLDSVDVWRASNVEMVFSISLRNITRAAK